ncbi:AEC family transporter [Brevibacterium yomogidense]|uniref:AEC family transporter n=1 Tax=Brevibacterium yomogidense TaxID=946573 RepID=UPI000B356847|nr:AEC family transporter [Brevibacterium yomogidense]
MSVGAIAAALVPIAALLALGAVLRRLRGFSSPDFWSGAERLAYFVLLPMLLFTSIATVDLGGVPVGRVAVAVVVPTLLVTGILFALNRVVAPTAAAFTSVLQGSVRFNTYVGVSLAVSLAPGEGAALAGIVGAVLVPLVNVIATLGFEVFLVDKSSLLSLVGKVVLNPLVLACVLGAAVGTLPFDMPEVVIGVLDPLAAAALPVGLLCVGAGLRRIELRTHAVGLVVASSMKLLVLPALTLGGLILVGVSGPVALVALIFQSIGTASTSYVLARQLGGDSSLMAALIAFQTVASFVTLPFVLLVGSAVLV